MGTSARRGLSGRGLAAPTRGIATIPCPGHTVLLEWTARDPTASTYDGGPPPELLRIEQPFGNHNAGHLVFIPLAFPGDAEYGVLYVGVADGGSGGDPLGLAQDPIRRESPDRTDLRFGAGPEGRVLLLNKHDGAIRELVP